MFVAISTGLYFQSRTWIMDSGGSTYAISHHFIFTYKEPDRPSPQGISSSFKRWRFHHLLCGFRVFLKLQILWKTSPFLNAQDFIRACRVSIYRAFIRCMQMGGLSMVQGLLFRVHICCQIQFLVVPWYLHIDNTTLMPFTLRETLLKLLWLILDQILYFTFHKHNL